MVKVKCPECGKEVNSRGLGGHLYGIHMIRTGTKQRMNELLARNTELEKRLVKIRNIVEKPPGISQSYVHTQDKLKEIDRIISSD